MAIELVKEEIQVPKEMQDVRKFLVGLVEDIKAKKDVSLIAAENLPTLMIAIEGFSQLGEEAKDEHAPMLFGLLAADLAKVFMK